MCTFFLWKMFLKESQEDFYKITKSELYSKNANSMFPFSSLPSLVFLTSYNGSWHLFKIVLQIKPISLEFLWSILKAILKHTCDNKQSFYFIIIFLQCSMTFGNSDLFGRFSSCAWQSDLSTADCVSTYMQLYGTVIKTPGDMIILYLTFETQWWPLQLFLLLVCVQRFSISFASRKGRLHAGYLLFDRWQRRRLHSVVKTLDVIS